MVEVEILKDRGDVTMWVSFLSGMVVGGVFGVLTTSVLTACSNADDYEEFLRRSKETEKEKEKEDDE